MRWAVAALAADVGVRVSPLGDVAVVQRPAAPRAPPLQLEDLAEAPVEPGEGEALVEVAPPGPLAKLLDPERYVFHCARYGYGPCETALAWSRTLATECCDIRVFPDQVEQVAWGGQYEVGGGSYAERLRKLPPGLIKVFVMVTQFEDFLRGFQRLPATSRVVLVSGAEDVGQPKELFGVANAPAPDTADRAWVPRVAGFDLQAFLRDPRLAHWYAQNLDACPGELGPKVSSWPLGVNFHSYAERTWNPARVELPQEQEQRLLEIKQQARKWASRTKAVYGGFRDPQAGPWEPAERAVAKQRLQELGWWRGQQKRDDFWSQASQYQFAAAPSGRGWDSHRLYELLALGTVPVLQRSCFALQLEQAGVPVLIVQNWTALGPELLEHFAERHPDLEHRMQQVVQLKYWTDQVDRSAKLAPAAPAALPDPAPLLAQAERRQLLRTSLARMIPLGLLALVAAAAPAASRCAASKHFAPLASGLAYLVLSAGLIFFNKWLLDATRFPHPLALTALHLVFTSASCFLLYRTPLARHWFAAAPTVVREPRKMLPRLAVLALAGTANVALSNSAYLYCSVSFLQMCKEMNPALVYLAALVLALEAWSWEQALVLLVVVGGSVTCVAGELQFSAVGLALQLLSQGADVAKILLTQVLLSRQGLGLDPLTCVLCVSPMGACCALLALSCRWDPRVVADAQAFAPHLLASCCVALSLNVAIATAIQKLSGLGFVLCSTVKDVVIVAAPFALFGLTMPHQQVVGFAVAVTGVLLHSGRKVMLAEREREKQDAKPAAA